MNTTINDFQEAQECVASLLRKYSHKDRGVVPKWQTQKVQEQLKHVRSHMESIMYSQREVPLVPANFEDFVSLCCRAQMLLMQAIMQFPKEHQEWLKNARTPEAERKASDE